MTCAANGCDVELRDDRRPFCGVHWPQVPPPLRVALKLEWSPGKATPTYEDALRRAVEAVALRRSRVKPLPGQMRLPTT